MWASIFSCLSFVHANVVIAIDGQRAIGVYCDQEEAGVGVDEVGLVACIEVVDDGSFIEMGELGHVIGLVEFGWIDLINLVKVCLNLRAILKLNNHSAIMQVLYYPASNERLFRVFHPNISFAGEVILAFDGRYPVLTLSELI